MLAIRGKSDLADQPACRYLPVFHGIIKAMKTTIDSGGRIVIPKSIRQEADLRPGAVVEIRSREGRIEIEPSPAKVRLVRKGRLVVAVREQDGPALTSEAVEATREAVRRERSER